MLAGDTKARGTTVTTLKPPYAPRTRAARTAQRSLSPAAHRDSPTAVGLTRLPTVWLLDEPECPAYERYLQDEDGGGFYHSLVWRDVLARAGFGKPLYLVAMEADDVVGILPLFETHTASGKRLVSLPATPAAGTLASHEAARWLLESRALTLAEHRRYEGVLVRGFRPLSDQTADGTLHEWIRLPVSAVTQHQAGPATGRIAVSSLDAAAARQLSGVSSDWLARSLALCEQDTYHVLRFLQHDANGAVCAGAVCVPAGRYLHVLDWYPTPTDTLTGVQLLQRISRYASDEGAEQIEFPGCAQLKPWWTAASLRRVAKIAVEERLVLEPKVRG